MIHHSPNTLKTPVIANTSVIASAAKPSQSGFSLLEISVALMLLAAVTLGYLYNQSRQSAVSLARTQAGYYQVVSAAVTQYMSNNYALLKALPPKTCSDVQLFTESTAATPPATCGINALFSSGSASSPVSNGLQPTVAELKATGYLDSNFKSSFVWPTQLIMYAPSAVKANSSLASPEYRVQIQAWCNSAPPKDDSVCDNPALNSLVYNAQPFAKESSSGFIGFSRLDKLFEARTYLGANGLMAYDYAFKGGGALYTEGDKITRSNPLRFIISGSTLGVEGVLALQSTLPSIQTTPSPPPDPGPLTWAVPFSECDKSTADSGQLAYASKGASRVVRGSTYTLIEAGINVKACRDVNLYFPVLPKAVTTCKPNLPQATSPLLNYKDIKKGIDCKVSNPGKTPWTQCETVSGGGSKLGAYCWQPVFETHAEFGFNLSSPTNEPLKGTPEQRLTFEPYYEFPDKALLTEVYRRLGASNSYPDGGDREYSDMPCWWLDKEHFWRKDAWGKFTYYAPPDPENTVSRFIFGNDQMGTRFCVKQKVP